MVKREQVAKRSDNRHDLVRELEESKNFFWYYAGATLLFTIILFWKFVFSSAGEMLLSSDTIQAGIFWREYVTNHFRQIGAWLPLTPPVWNPYIFGGLPPVDAFHGDIFYLPTFIIKELFGPDKIYKAFDWGMILHVYLAGLFAYFCARGFGLSRLASAFAGVSYMFSGYLVSLVAPGHDGKMYVTALFPLAFHFLNRGTITHQLKYFLGLGLTIAFIILTPHPQMAYFSLWALGFFALFRIVFMFKDKVGIVKTGLVSVMFVFAVVVGLMGSAIQMWPGYKYISEFSPRAGEGAEGRSGYDWATSWSMHPEEAFGQVVPLFAGVDDGKDAGGYWGRNAFKDNTEYGGFMPLLLGIIAIALWRKREMWFLLGLGVFALIYALGDTTPLFHLFYAIIPNVKKMRAPSMIMFLFSFSFALLAAFAIDAIANLRSDKKSTTGPKLSKVLLIVAAILTLKALFATVAGESLLSLYSSIFYSGITPDNHQAMIGTLGTIQVSLWLIALLTWLTWYLVKGLSAGTIGRIAVIALIFASLVDLWRVDFRFIEVAQFSQYFPANMPIVQRLKQEPEPVRVMDFTRKSFSSKNFLAMNGIEQLVGYHGAQLKTFDEFIGGLTFKNLFDGQNLLYRPFQLTNTKYVILDRGMKLPEVDGVTKVYDAEVVMYQMPDVMRRVAIYHDYVLGSQTQDDLTTLLSPDFQFRDQLILGEEPEYKPELSPQSTAETIDILDHSIERQRYRVTLNSPGLLFVSENYFPAWKVKVDGVEKKTLLADHTFRAVSLDSGTHEVEFYYHWPRYDMSKTITIVTFLVSIAGLAGCLFYERRQKGTAA
jgi:hypothetical protein